MRAICNSTGIQYLQFAILYRRKRLGDRHCKKTPGYNPQFDQWGVVWFCIKA